MKAALHLFSSMLTFFVLLAATPAAGLADDNCPSAENLLKFAATESVPGAPLLPPSVHIAAGFQPGSGAPAGQARGIQGTVLVIHKGGAEAYALQNGSPIFAGDTLITAKDSRVTMELRDKSAVTLTSYSKLVIDRSLYNPDAGRRDTRLQLLLGRLRTVVSKVTGDSAYQVRTPTAVAGARGTDFALAVGPAPHKPSVLMTVLVTGGGSSTVELSGAGGSSSLVGPESVTGAVADCAVCAAEPVGPEAKKTLSRIAPELDSFAAAPGASASWSKKFLEEEEQFGLYVAVENALNKGIAPAEILAFITQNREKLTHPSMKALYCSGVDRELVETAAEQLGISKFESGRAFTESQAECGSKIALEDRDIVETPSVAEKPDPADLREKKDVPPLEPPQPAEPPKEDGAEKKDGQDSRPPFVAVPPPVDPSELIDYPDDSSGPVVSPSKPRHYDEY